MPASIKPPAQDKPAAIEFIVGQHSLFVAAIGQAFFYIHLFKPYLWVWVAGPFFQIPWAIVFMIFYAKRPLFPPRATRHFWLFAACCYALFTLIAELVWFLGYMPPITARPPATPLISVMIVQVLMNTGWLSFIPLVRDYLRNPHLWK